MARRVPVFKAATCCARSIASFPLGEDLRSARLSAGLISSSRRLDLSRRPAAAHAPHAAAHAATHAAHAAAHHSHAAAHAAGTHSHTAAAAAHEQHGVGLPGPSPRDISMTGGDDEEAGVGRCDCIVVRQFQQFFFDLGGFSVQADLVEQIADLAPGPDGGDEVVIGRCFRYFGAEDFGELFDTRASLECDAGGAVAFDSPGDLELVAFEEVGEPGRVHLEQPRTARDCQLQVGSNRAADPVRSADTLTSRSSPGRT